MATDLPMVNREGHTTLIPLLFIMRLLLEVVRPMVFCHQVKSALSLSERSLTFG